MPRSLMGGLAAVVGSAVLVSGCSVASDPGEVAPPVYVEQPTLSSTAEAKGADAARDAAAWAQRFVLTRSFDKRFLDSQRDYTEADLVSAMEGSLSEAALAHWRAEAASAVEGDELARENLTVLTYVAPNDDPLTLPSDGEPVRSQRVTDVKVSVDPLSQLYTVSLDYAADLQLQEGRKPVALDASKRMSLMLRPVQAPTSATPAAVPGTTPPGTAAATTAAPGAWVIEEYEGELTLEPE